MSFFSKVLNLRKAADPESSDLRPKADSSSGFAGGFGLRFLDASDQYATGRAWINPPRDFNEDVNGLDYDVVTAACRRLYANNGVVKGPADDKATYAVGRAWLPKFTGKDKQWGKSASDWLAKKYYPICDVRGSIYDFRTNLHIDSVQIDVSGDFGILLTETETGWPQTQRIPSHRITSGDVADGGLLEEGPYTGLKIRRGVIYNKLGRAVAYRIKTDAGLVDVSARDFIHVFDPAWYDQGRGLPAYTHCINDLISLKKTQGFEQMAMEILSSIGLVEENEEGGPDPTDPSFGLRTPSTPGNSVISKGMVLTKSLFGGLYKYFRAGTGGKLSTLSHNRPGPNWESFWNRVIKAACCGLSWPYELFWAIASLGGANLRASLAKANRSVEDRQDVLRPPALRQIQYAIAKAIKLGELEQSDEWFMWEFTLPPKITVDVGREAQQQREDYKLKITTLHDILSPQGGDTEIHYRQLALEYQQRQDIAKETGVPVEVLGQLPKPTVVNETIKE